MKRVKFCLRGIRCKLSCPKQQALCCKSPVVCGTPWLREVPVTPLSRHASDADLSGGRPALVSMGPSHRGSLRSPTSRSCEWKGSVTGGRLSGWEVHKCRSDGVSSLLSVCGVSAFGIGHPCVRPLPKQWRPIHGKQTLMLGSRTCPILLATGHWPLKST